MSIGIIGYGVVGRAAEATLSRGYNVFKYDKFSEYDSFESLGNCKYVFITVPTPFNYQEKVSDDNAVIESLEKLEKIAYSGIVIIKSTLIPGSCDRYQSRFDLEVVHNPEFLRESTTPKEDFQNQDTVVIGTGSIEVFESIKRMYQKVLAENANYYHTSISEAEMIKCSQNTILASRVALSNMIYDACEDHNILYDNVRELAFDNCELIGPHMVQVPGPDGKRGFGGKCLPKDIMAFSKVHKSDLLKQIIKYNYSLRDDLDQYLENYEFKND